MVETSLTGGCHCGAVRYQLAHPPYWSMICHCRTCQGISGAPVLAWITAAQATFRFTLGTPQFYASSPGVMRTFCGHCGTPLTYRMAKTPESVDITTASLDMPDLVPPTHHSWTAHDIVWIEFGDGLPQFPGPRNEAEADRS